MARIDHLPVSAIKARISEIRDDIRSAEEDSSLSYDERDDLISDLYSDLRRYQEELQYRS